MKFLDLLVSDKKIVLTHGVSQFKSVEGMLMVKHNNRLFTISTSSDSDGSSRLFRMLRQPKKLSEILKTLSEFKKNDIIANLQTLYQLDIISFETTPDSGTTSDDSFPSKINNVKDRKESRKEITLVGSGVLANKLILHMRNMNIKIHRIKNIPSAHIINYEKVDHKSVPKSKFVMGDTLSSFPLTMDNFIERSDLIIVAGDYPNISLFEWVNAACFKKGRPWIRVSFDDNLGYIGPLVIPKKTACFNCCQLRLIANSPYYEYEVWKNKNNIPPTKLKLPNIFGDILTSIAGNKIQMYLQDSNVSDLVDNLFILETKNIEFSKHRIISHPNCILCNPPTKTKSKTRRFSIGKNPLERISPLINDSNNKSSISENELILSLRELIDDKTGLILEYERLYENSKLGRYLHHFSTTTCSRPLRIGLNGEFTNPIESDNSLISPSPTGSGFLAKEAELRVLMESVERYSNMVVDESRIIWSKYADVERNAINPKELGLYNDELYDRKDLLCSRFSINSKIPWIWGHDIISDSPILIPADFVYYPAIRQMPLVFDTSNGASAHTSLTQAILNGLFEVIERDSFLSMWLNKISMPVLSVKKIPFGFSETMTMVDKFGMVVKLLDLTNDTGVTTIMAVCYNKKPEKYPALIIGSASHVDPQKALQKALFEMEFALIEALENPKKKKVNDPNEISSIYQNSRYYLNPSRRKYWYFMISGKKTSRLDILKRKTFKNNFDMLMQVVRHLHKMDHKVVWVDITPSDMKKRGLVVVKVFVTGFQPLYIGNKLRLNLDRLNAHARNFGLDVKSTRSASELNLAPHPLP